MPNLTGPRLKQKRQIQHSLSHYTSLEQQGIHTALLSSAKPNAFIMHTLNLYSFFPNNSARFYVVAKRRAPNWGKWRVKKDNLTHLALGIQNILIHGGRNTKDKKTYLRWQEYFCIPCSVKGWIAGSSVGYCEPCFRKVTDSERA